MISRVDWLGEKSETRYIGMLLGRGVEPLVFIGKVLIPSLLRTLQMVLGSSVFIFVALLLLLLSW